jgi:phytanoyl-CoA hydroxylase
MDGATAVMSPDLYRESMSATGLTGGFAAVDDAAAARFHAEGYLVVEDAFSSDEMASALEGLTYLMDGADGEFRGVQYEPSMRNQVADLAVEERRAFVRKVFNFVDYDERLKAISEHAGMLGALELLIGKPPTLFQDMALSKPPRLGSEKPWHQDAAYFNFHPDTPVVGAWIALDEATYENGCMHVIPGSHLDGPITHFQRRDWQICDTDVKADANVVAPLQPGGCLFFHGLVHHGTPPNQTDGPRRALQLHYRPEEIVTVTAEERLAVYGDEGKDVTC